jgi:soluble lytic murein transglycosylase
MPRVPEYDNFKVMPNIQPVGAVNSGISAEASTIGARQLIRAGEQIQRGGQELANLEVDALARANQLRIDESLNKLKEAELKMRFDPQNGFENIRGKDALERASGKSLTQDYTEMLQQHASEIENGLANDAQKQAFRMNANNIITSFGGSVEQHEGKEFQSYALSVRDGTIQNRMTEIGLNYNNPEAVDEAVTSIAAATYDQARLMGKSAEWAEAQTREATSKAHRTAIETALQNNNPTFADMYMKKYAKTMQPDDILAVNGHVTKELDSQIAADTATQVMQEVGPKITTSDSDRAFNIALGTESGHRQFAADGSPLLSPKGATGIAQVMPATGPEAAKLAGVPWDENKFKNDAAYNKALGKAYFEKQLQDFDGNLAMAYAAYNAGPGRLQQAINKANAVKQPQNWVAYLPKETQDYVAKNMSAFGNGAGQFEKPTLVELQQEVRKRIGDNQPQRLRLALDETERQYNSMNQAIKQKNEEAVATAMRGVMENGGRYTALPANIRGSVAPEDVTKVMDFAKRIAAGDDTTDLLTYQQLSSNPGALVNMSDAEFFSLRKTLSQSDHKHFAELRGKLLNGTAPNGPGDLNTEAIGRTLNERLTSMGIDPTPKDDSNEARQVGAIRRFIDQSIAVEQQNRGKKMSDVEVAGYVDKLFAQQGLIKHWYGDSSGPLLAMQVSDIPSTTKDSLKEAFKRNGINTPTDADLLNAYWRQTTMMQKKETNKTAKNEPVKTKNAWYKVG